MEDTRRQSRLAAVLDTLKSGVGWGLVSALAGSVLSYFFLERGLVGALNGVNGAGLALGAFAGCFVLGSAQGRRLDANLQMRGLPDLPPSSFPWGQVLAALLGSGTCALVWLVASRLL